MTSQISTFESVKNKVNNFAKQTAASKEPVVMEVARESVDMRKAQRRNYLYLVSELKTLTVINSNFDNKREEISGKVGEFVSLSYAMHTEDQRKIEQLKTELEKAMDENNKLRLAVVNLASLDSKADSNLVNE